jgi:hypothetical protein
MEVFGPGRARPGDGGIALTAAIALPEQKVFVARGRTAGEVCRPHARRCRRHHGAPPIADGRRAVSRAGGPRRASPVARNGRQGERRWRLVRPGATPCRLQPAQSCVTARRPRLRRFRYWLSGARAGCRPVGCLVLASALGVTTIEITGSHIAAPAEVREAAAGHRHAGRVDTDGGTARRTLPPWPVDLRSWPTPSSSRSRTHRRRHGESHPALSSSMVKASPHRGRAGGSGPGTGCRARRR